MLHLKTKLFFLPIEIKTRELYPKLFFLKKALEKNYSAFIGDKAGIFRATKYFSNGVYFYKSINFTDKGHIIKIKKRNNKYIVLDEEGGFSFSNNKEYLKFLTYRTSRENVNLIDRFFNWGKFDYLNCINRYPKFKKKFKISGGIRFEICDQNILNKIYQGDILKLKKIYKKKHILITTSHLTSKKEIKNYMNSDETFMKIKNKTEKNLRYKELVSLYELNLEFRNLIKSLAKNFKDIPIVIRPHPSENLNDWKEFINKYFYGKENIYINVKQDLNSVIRNSLCVINSKSSSGLHAFFQNIPIISFIPKKVKYRKRVFDYMGSEANNINEVIKFVSLIKDNKKLNKTKKKSYKLLSNNIYNFVKNNNSSKIILKEVDKIYKNKSEINKLLIIFLSPLYKVSDFIFKILKIRYHSEKLSSSAIRLSKEKLHDGINKYEIKNFFQNLGISKNINIISFGKNCFFIYRKN